MTRFEALWRDESGATSIEYALIAGLIALAIIGSLTTLGTRLSAKFAPISGNLN